MACATADPRLFDSDSPRTLQVDGARRFCAGCPSRVDCASQARCDGQIGVLGGLLFRVPGGKPIDLLAIPPSRFTSCGTQRGYSRHYDFGETPCAACLVAHQKDHKERRAHLRLVQGA